MRLIDESDEGPHSPGPDLGWNESYGLDLYGDSASIAGFARIVARPNEGAMEAGLHVVLPDDGFVAARHVKPASANVADTEVGGIRLARVDAGEGARWRISYDGPSHSIPDFKLAGSGDAWRKSRVERLSVELEFAPLAPPFPSVVGFRQAGRLTGSIWVSGDEYPVDATGQRVRAWGAIPWGSLRRLRTISATFPDGTALTAMVSESADEEAEGGWIVRDGRSVGLRRVRIATELDPESHLPRGARLDLEDEDGRQHEVRCSVVRAVPLPGARGGRDWLTCEAVSQVTYDGRTGAGLATYLHEVGRDGAPLLPVDRA